MAITAGSNLNSTPSSIQKTLASNYLDLTGTTASTNWAQQYVPDLMEKEAEIFGPRTITGFLSQVGAEDAMKNSATESKNIDMSPRQELSENLDGEGIKVRTLNDDSSDFKFKIKNKNK